MRWLLIGVLIVAAVIALMAARRVVAPVDSLITRQACSTHGREELSRQLVDHERSNGFSITDRTDGHCVFGPVVVFDEDGDVVDPDPDSDSETDAADTESAAAEDIPDETVTVSLAEIEKSDLYRAMKVMFVILQLGAASVAIRLLAEPLFDRAGSAPR